MGGGQSRGFERRNEPVGASLRGRPCSPPKGVSAPRGPTEGRPYRFYALACLCAVGLILRIMNVAEFFRRSERQINYHGEKQC